jgi:hypothetical protein
MRGRLFEALLLGFALFVGVACVVAMLLLEGVGR